MGKEDHSPLFRKKPTRSFTVDDCVSGVLEGNRAMLARTITLIESQLSTDFRFAQDVLRQLMPYTGNSIRVGISGPPGAGKSSFIESLGMYLCKRGERVAALTIDPSSPITKGSILGDKTRMEQLARHPLSFIRPTASGGELGGVARKTRETILVCEAAGYNVILVETVGVGQSEIAARGMVDFFLLLQITGAGDELQGIKKGTLELADAVAINKADGANREPARRLAAEYNQWFRFVAPEAGWTVKAYPCSALRREGIEEIWQAICQFQRLMKQNGAFDQRREDQAIDWLRATIRDCLHTRFFSHSRIQRKLPELEAAIRRNSISVTQAALDLIEMFDREK